MAHDFAFRKGVGLSPAPAAQTPEGADVISQSLSVDSHTTALFLLISFYICGEDISHVAFPWSLTFQAGHPKRAGALDFHIIPTLYPASAD